MKNLKKLFVVAFAIFLVVSITSCIIVPLEKDATIYLENRSVYVIDEVQIMNYDRTYTYESFTGYDINRNEYKTYSYYPGHYIVRCLEKGTSWYIDYDAYLESNKTTNVIVYEEGWTH